MKKLLAAMWLPVMGLCTSCDKEVTVENVAENGKLVVYCIPSNVKDTTFIQLLWSRSLNGETQADRTTDRAEVSFRVNGVERETGYAGRLPRYGNGNTFYAVGRLKEGDEVEVKAQLPGLPAVTARTSVPSCFPLEKVEGIRLSVCGYQAVMFQITLRDCAEVENYYGIRILRKRIFPEGVTIGVPDSVVKPLVLHVENEPLMNNKLGVDDVFDLSNDFYQHLYIYGDHQINGRTYTLNLDCFERNHGTAQPADDKVYYKVVLFALSSDLYKYLKSVNALNNNDLGKAGLAPIYKRYTNVVNGIGIVGGCHLYETDWMEASGFCR